MLRLTAQGKVETESSHELTHQIVGGLMRRKTHMAHCSQRWGDPALDDPALLDKLEHLYPYAVLMRWIFAHPVEEQTYDLAVQKRFTDSEQVKVRAAQGVQFKFVSQKKEQVEEMVFGMLPIITEIQMKNHQLGAAIVAANPPRAMTLVKEKRWVPVPRDVTGMIAQPAVLIAEAECGNPLYEAYNCRSELAIVSELERVLNYSPMGESLAHTAVLETVCARQAPGSFSVASKNGLITARPLDKEELDDSNERTLIQEHTRQVEAAKVLKWSRKSTPYEGFFVGDVGGHLGHKIHMLMNVKRACDLLDPPPLEVRGTNDQGFHLYMLNHKYYTQMQSDDENAVLRPRGEVPRTRLFDMEIQRVMMASRGHANDKMCLDMMITVAQPVLWTRPDFMILPYDYSTGRVIVAHRRGVGSHTKGHITEKEFTKRYRLFFDARIRFPFTRMTWEEINDDPPVEIYIKRAKMALFLQ